MREGSAPSRIRPWLGQPVSPIRISLPGKASRHLLANVIHMRGRVFGAGRNVFPIGQEMNGDEIDIVADFPVAQPEFPDIGVGHRNTRRAA